MPIKKIISKLRGKKKSADTKKKKSTRTTRATGKNTTTKKKIYTLGGKTRTVTKGRGPKGKKKKTVVVKDKSGKVIKSKTVMKGQKGKNTLLGRYKQKMKQKKTGKYKYQEKGDMVKVNRRGVGLQKVTNLFRKKGNKKTSKMKRKVL
tara:strand:+ start:366 stop:809 length:444 start_codon:yes stop_codon:yes gene_type:complete